MAKCNQLTPLPYKGLISIGLSEVFRLKKDGSWPPATGQCQSATAEMLVLLISK